MRIPARSLLAKKDFGILLLIVAVSLAVYWPSFQNNFLIGDDQGILTNNQYVRNWDRWSHFFTENYKAGAGEITNFWRPVQMLFALVTVQTLGMEKEYFHLTSILFHALCGFLIFQLLQILFVRRCSKWLLLFGSLLWVVHPVQNEEIAVTTGVASPTHTFGILLAIICSVYFVRSRSWWFFTLALAAQIFALMSKESAVIFPGLALITLLFDRKQNPEPWQRSRFLLLQSLQWILAIGYFILRLTILNFDNTLNFYKTENPLTESFQTRLITFITILVQQFKSFIFPSDLHAERSWSVYTDWIEMRVGLAVLCLLLILFVLWRFRKTHPVAIWGFLWVLIAYLPTSQLFAQIHSLIWDHWLYLPSIGLIAIVIDYLKTVKIAITAWVLGLVILIFSTISYSRNEIWLDSESSAREILRHEPNNLKSLVNLATALDEKGQVDQAIELFRKAITTGDYFPHSHHNLALALQQKGQLQEAEKEFRRALEIQPDFYYSMNKLAELLQSSGRVDEAAEFRKKSLQVNPAQAH